MEKIVSIATKLVEFVLFLLLVGMVIMVAGNVILRYGFSSGIVFSEEMSRYFFVWMTFVGAVLAFKENGHIGVETLVSRFGRKGRLVCMFLSNLVILFCMVIFFWGTWLQHSINQSMSAAVFPMSMIWVYGIGYFTSLGIGSIALMRLIMIATGKVSDADIARFAGEFDDEKAGGHA